MAQVFGQGKFIRKIALASAVAIFVIASAVTYFAVGRAHKSVTNLMRKDAVSLAEMFIEGARAIFESQVSLINDLRMRLMVYARQVKESGGKLGTIPPEMAYAVILDSEGDIISRSGVATPEVSGWLAEIEDIVQPILSGNRRSLFFGLNPQFPASSGPVGYAEKFEDKILVIFAYPPYHRQLGIGYLARQLAETPSVRYILLQNKYGVLIASKDVYRVRSINSDPFLQRVLASGEPDVRFTEFQGERVFELAYPFPTMGKFSGVLRIGFPLSEYRDMYSVIVWMIFLGGFLGILSAAAIIMLSRVGAKMLALQREHEKLAQLRSLGEIAASVAHEIRNPLNAISISLQRLQAEFEPEDFEEYSQIIASGLAQTKRIDEIVREFIAVAGNVAPVREEVPLGQLFGPLCEEFEIAAAGKGINFECEISGGTAKVDVDKFRRVIRNILKNALEETPAGKKISLRAGIEGKNLVAEIFNEGSRIPEEIIDRIFEPFATGKSGGTGIGLFYAHRIVEAHGGEIFAQNEENGVKFTIKIPAK
ncbi:HAMP domain-containing histidine kinase [bacterium]|nr:HAMP domain-containing histidine kinase [bacterium]